MTTEPPFRRRLIGAALRQRREALGLTLGDVTTVLDCDRSKISRIETGQRGIRSDELRKLLDEYGTPAETAGLLASLSARHRDDGWWQGFRDVLSPEAIEYIALEARATGVRVAEAQRVPELLQTAGYARGLAEADPGLPPGAAGLIAEATLIRQQVVLGERRTPVEAVIHEGALYQAAGGTEVMRAQYARLLELSGERNGISVRVIRFRAGAHAAANVGSLTILTFPADGGIQVAHVGGPGGGTCSTGEQADLAARIFSNIQAYAESPEASARFLQSLADH